jgi:hypothetical protein
MVHMHEDVRSCLIAAPTTHNEGGLKLYGSYRHQGGIRERAHGMWTEVIAVIIIVLANVVCYVAHEKSLLHGHLRLPKILFASNRYTQPKRDSCTPSVMFGRVAGSQGHSDFVHPCRGVCIIYIPIALSANGAQGDFCSTAITHLLGVRRTRS